MIIIILEPGVVSFAVVRAKWLTAQWSPPPLLKEINWQVGGVEVDSEGKFIGSTSKFISPASMTWHIGTLASQSRCGVFLSLRSTDRKTHTSTIPDPWPRKTIRNDTCQCWLTCTVVAGEKITSPAYRFGTLSLRFHVSTLERFIVIGPCHIILITNFLFKKLGDIYFLTE